MQGYRVEESGGGGADGGVDLVLSRDGEIHLVQCKHWRAYKVGVDVVRELYGVMTARGAAAGFVVTSGSFTQAASEFTNGRNLTLIDGPRLGAMIKKAQASQAAPNPSAPSVGPAVPARRESEPQTRPVPMSAAPAPAASPTPAAAPLCPRCGSSMVGRTARRGASAGAGFWGCSGYPACRGTRPID
ncbi:MAG: restriction endonuclease [Burkholderiaceae bacterium]